jgi:saccharopine dehydrogenase-like NADP-dependent oxidoreductase
MARVLALGGCGEVGRYAVRTLLREEPLAEVVVADLDGERASAWAAECGPRVTARRLDVTDEGALRSALAEVDVVMNTVGPYFRFGVPVLRASLEVGRSYLDVCDDWEPTLRMLELDSLAREMGSTAVIGLGITPGVSNLLAALAVAELDAAEQVITGWDVESAMPEHLGPEPSAATLHGVEQLTGKIRVRRDGRFVDERPIREVRFEYPGIGPCRAWTIGHPEPVTLPLTFDAIRESLNVMAASPWTILGMRALRGLVDGRLLSPRRAAKWAERFGRPGGRTPLLADLVREASRRGRMMLPPLFALARGSHEGQTAAAAVMLLSAPPGGLGGTTGIPLGVGVSMLLRGQIPRKGVFAPEAGVDPRQFLDRLAPLCVPPRASGSALTLVTRSWRPKSLLEELRSTLDL